MNSQQATLTLLSERRFSGRRASLDAMAKALDQALHAQRPSRIEVRLAQGDVLLSQDAVHARLHAVLRQHRVEGLAVSVRPFESELDRVQGEHLMRLLGHEVQPSPLPRAAGAEPSVRAGWRGWLQRFLAPRRTAMARQEPSVEPSVEPRPDTGAAAASKPRVAELSLPEAAKALREALGLAVQDWAHETQAVRALRLTVHAEEAHGPLQRLVQRDPNAPQALARLLADQGLDVCADAPLQVSYRYLAPDRDAATQMAGAGDVKVELFAEALPDVPATPSAPSAAAATAQNLGTPPVLTQAVQPVARAVPTELPLRHDQAPFKPQTGPTALPGQDAQAPLLQVRLMGTSTEGAFARPVSLRVKRFPFVIDRPMLDAALRSSGRQIDLCAVSNTAPLRVERVNHTLLLSAPRRAVPGAPEGGVALYHQRTEAGAGAPQPAQPISPCVGAPLPECSALSTQSLPLWLNDPRSASALPGDEPLPVLWIELQAVVA